MRAAAGIARFAILAAVLFALVAVRTTGGVIAGSAFTLAAVFGVYVAFGKRQGMSELLVYLLGFALFAQARAFGDDTGVPHFFTYVVSADTLAGVLPSTWLQEHLYTPGSNGLLVLTTSGVYVSYFVVVHVVALYLWARRRELFGLYAGTMLLTFYSGLLCSFVLPTAPPWLAAQHGDTSAVHRVFQEMVNGLQSDAYAAGSTAVGQNDVAAMPSLHMAITVAIALFAWKLDRRLGIAGAIYAFAMGFSLVFLGEHYVTDVVAGAVFAAGAWILALRIWQTRLEAEEVPVEEQLSNRPAAAGRAIAA
jgi:membrane-associated phospholipid phosphatase